MAAYRIDLLNGSGRIVPQFNAKCNDDGEACALAQRLLSFGERAEVWIGGRCAGRVSVASAAEVKCSAGPGPPASPAGRRGSAAR